MNMRTLSIAGFSLMLVGVAPVLLAVPVTQLEERGDGGFWIGPVNLSPTLDASVFYDSNPDEVSESRKRLMEDAEDYDGDRFESAVGYNIQPGLNVTLPGNRWSLISRLYYVYERDDSDYTRSPKDWSVSTALQGDTEGGLQWQVGQVWQQLSYEKYDEFSQEDRQAFRLHGNLAKAVTEKSRVSLGANYSNVKYDDEFAYDTKYTTFSLGVSHQLTEKTDGIVSLAYGINESEDESSKAHQYNLSVGLGSRATEKLNYRALIGVSMYEDFEYELPDGSREDSESDYSLSYDLSVNWRPTERISVNLTGGSSYEAAEDVRQDSLLAYTLVCSMNYRMFQRLQLSSGVAYRHEDYLRNVKRGGEDVFTGTKEDGDPRKDDQINVFGNVTFGLNRYASLFLNGLYSVTDSDIDDFDYDRYRISAGVALKY